MSEKKKVCIVTILDVANFGSMLQAYALATVIEHWGYAVTFVNYWRKDYTTRRKVFTFLTDLSLGPLPKRVLFALSALLFYAPIRYRVRRFVTKHFSFTYSYYSFRQLLKAPPLADCFICGSDQIWNSVYNGGLDRVFYLDFTNLPRLAYAASSGLETFPEQELPQIRLMLDKFVALSVREDKTCDYLHNLGYPAVRHVLDPSLLLDIEEWKRVISYSKSPHKKSPYLLVYSVERFNNDFIFSQAYRIAHERNLKMYVVATTYPVHAKKYGFDRIYSMADVPTFLRLMLDAEFVVVSSFHGTAFALNFNKDFVTISANKYNLRMESLIQQFGISHRVVRNVEISSNDLSPIDYMAINEKLHFERKESLAFLGRALEACFDIS